VRGERLTEALGNLDALARVFGEVGVDGETLRHEMRPVPAQTSTADTPKGVPSAEACVV